MTIKVNVKERDKNKVYKPLTQKDLDEAIIRGQERFAIFPVSTVSYDSKNDKIIFNMKDGTTKELNVYDIEELQTASKEDLKNIRFSTFGIHLESLDLDISIEGLLKDKGLIVNEYKK